jgi:hypothetical protein
MAINFGQSINLNKNELQNARVQNLASAPSSPVDGQIYWDTVLHSLFVYDANSTSWKDTLSATVSYAAPSATINAGDSASAGAASTVLRSDAQFAVSTASAGTVSGSNAEGSATSLARSDHNHALGTGVVGTTQLAAGVRLDTINAPTATVSFNSQKISNLADGTAAGDAVNLGQLQAAQAGIDPKQSVRTSNGIGNITVSNPGTSTFDGVALTSGDRIVLKNQSAPAENGIYVFNGSGVAMTRATDMDAWSEVPGAYVWVEEGTIWADTAWICTNDPGGTLNTTAITWAVFSVSSTTAGNGLTYTGGVLAVVGTTNRISVAADSIDISSSYVGQASITTLGTITTGVWDGTDVAVTAGGTGSSTAAGARTNLKSAGYYTETGTGTAATYTITQATHGIGGADRHKFGRVTVISDGSEIFVEQSINGSGDITYTFGASQTLSNYRFHVLAA